MPETIHNPDTQGNGTQETKLASHGGAVTTPWGVPGVSPITSGTQALASGEVHYFPIAPTTDIVLSDVALEVTTAGGGSAAVKVAIFATDDTWTPTDLIASLGSVAAASTGKKEINSLEVELLAATYLVAVRANEAVTLRTYMGGPREWSAINPVLGVNWNRYITRKLSDPTAYASWPAATAAAPDSAAYANTSQPQGVFFKWSVGN